jgi:hypothetical protein
MKGYIPDIIEEVKSGIIHIVHVVDGKRVSSGTGFMVNGYLVTNYHVIYGGPKDSKIILRTYDSNINEPLKGIIELERDEDGHFSGKTNKGYKNEEGDFIKDVKPDKEQDYIIFNIPELKEAGLYNFSFETHDNKRVGEDIFFLGYHLEHSRLSCHKGIISCFYFQENHRVDIIQLDASVNNSNSGSPLINPNTSKVIGIVTQKESGLTKNFSNFDQNIQTLKNELKTSQENIDSCKAQISSNAAIKIFNESRKTRESGAGSTINLNDAAIIMEEEGITLEITKHLSNSITRLLEVSSKLSDISKEMKRSANVGIGYAYSVEHLMNRNFYKDKN